MNASPRRGFVYYAMLDKRRPVLVVSPNYRNSYLSNVLAIP
jgi:mRNA-degrading endonuclease toxin of MazEF toxin-antitoxin module